ncbi:MAG TPA: hypothetical protein VLX12_01875 [Syntrophorhabdales bacterium]|nr:hypothetical protein [Syntrophorhabdales bacterium]
MDLAHFSELIKAIPFGRDHAKVISPFDGQEKRSNYAVLESLHRIITLSLRCFNGWPKTLLSHSVKETVNLVQDRDPYLESLLIALHNRK